MEWLELLCEWDSSEFLQTWVRLAIIPMTVGGIYQNSFRVRRDWSDYIYEMGKIGQNSYSRWWDWSEFHHEQTGFIRIPERVGRIGQRFYWIRAEKVRIPLGLGWSEIHKTGPHAS